jgi:ATP synthase protein I
MKRDSKNNTLYKLQRIQLSILCILVVFFGGFQGATAAFMALLGGMVAWIPALVFAKVAFLHQGATRSRQIVKQFYKAEAYKIIVTSLLFTFVFLLYKIRPLPFFLSYIAVVFAQGVAPLFVKKNPI